MYFTQKDFFLTSKMVYYRYDINYLNIDETLPFLSERTTMTTIYFVRHAEPDYQNHNDRLRELTEKGLEDSRSVTAFLSDKKIDLILSSPYRRAIDTIKNFADKNEMPILIVDDFREIRNFMPWILQFDFFANDFVSMREYRLCKNLWREIFP